ncbi:MAG: helix-turn-helix transcriptional regulator [Bradyrhizobium sp.]|nr:helix-turn-helix transcriptional regulator [Bradyrhizobium sp.]
MDCFDLITWRKKRRMKQYELATHLGVTRQTVSNWESNRHLMPRDIVEQLERVALDLTANQDKHTSKAATNINPDTARHLYVLRRGIWEQTPDHPEQLFPGRWDGAIPLAFLQTDEYRQTAARALEELRIRSAQLSVPWEPPVVPHAPACRCTVCRSRPK